MARQTSVSEYANKATAGMRSSNVDCFIDTKVNGSLDKKTITVTAANLETVATVNGTAYVYDSKTVTITAANAATVATVNGNAYTANVAAATKTKTEISTELAALINAGETGEAVASVVGETCVILNVSSAITVVGTTNCTVAQTAVSTTVIAAGLVTRIAAGEALTVTSNAAIVTVIGTVVGTAFTAVGTTNCSVAVVNHNASAIPFGVFVSVDINDENNCKLPAVATDVTGRGALGFSEFTNTRENTDEGWKINADVNYVRKGTIWAVAEEAMLMTDTVYVRHTANGTGKLVIGAVRNDNDSSTCAALDGCSVLRYDSTTGLVELHINLPA
jgi:hypothetical protein